MNKTIFIYYWNGQTDLLGYPHNHEFEYSRDKAIELVTQVIDAGYDVKTRDTESVFKIIVTKKLVEN